MVANLASQYNEKKPSSKCEVSLDTGDNIDDLLMIVQVSDRVICNFKVTITIFVAVGEKEKEPEAVV